MPIGRKQGRVKIVRIYPASKPYEGPDDWTVLHVTIMQTFMMSIDSRRLTRAGARRRYFIHG